MVVNLSKDPVTGRRRQHWESVKGSKRNAEKRLAELLHDIDIGGHVLKNDVALGAYLDRWLEEYARPRVAPKTFEAYEHYVRRHLVRNLGGVRLQQLSTEHIQTFYAKCLSRGRLDGNGGLSARTVRHIHMTLHDALEDAVGTGLLIRNVAKTARLPLVDKVEIKTLDESGIRRLLEAAKPTAYHALFNTAITTGLRRSELLALRWSDVDLDFATISVNRSMHRLRDRTAKTAKSRRMVALPPSTALLLREELSVRQGMETILRAKSFSDDSLVFSGLDGQPLNPDTVSQAWRRLVRSIGLGGVRFHDTRHTHATLMLKQGVHPKIVQERLGHSTISTTLDTYSHVLTWVTSCCGRALRQFFGRLPTKR